MKSLLFALGLALCCFVQANRDIDPSLILKQGVVSAMITNCQKMKKMIPHMPASYVSFEKLSEDEVQMTMEMATPQGCKTIKPMLKKKNGRFITKCGMGGTKTLEDLQINGEESMFSSIIASHKKGQCRIATLTVSDMALTPGALDGFRDFANTHGLENEETHILSTDGMCPRSS